MDISYQASQVKQYDNDRYVCCLFTNKKKQENLLTIISFQNEIELIIRSDKDQLAKLIRLTWWQEAINKLYIGKIEQQPILNSLARLIEEFKISQDLFNDFFANKLIEVHEELPSTEKEIINFAKKDGYDSLLMMVIILASKVQENNLENIALAWKLIQILKFKYLTFEVKEMLIDYTEKALSEVNMNYLRKNAAPIDLLYFLFQKYIKNAKYISPKIYAQQFEMNPLKKQLILSYHYLFNLK